MICEVGLERIQSRGHHRDELSADSADGWPLFTKPGILRRKTRTECYRDSDADEE